MARKTEIDWLAVARKFDDEKKFCALTVIANAKRIKAAFEACGYDNVINAPCGNE